MVTKLFQNPETRRILIYLGAAGLCAIVGGTIYAAAMNAVTPTSLRLPLNTSSASSVTPTRTVTLKGRTLRVAVADTPEERDRGLSGTAGLGNDQGMLFVFPEEGIYGFWMKGMRYSLDIIWIANDGRVVYIVRDATPQSFPTDFLPDTPARYVLELPAGWANAHGVSIGDSVSL